MSDELRVLAEYPADLQISQADFLASAGGMSGAQFWQITSPRGPFILRRWPVESPSADRLRFIHAVLQHVARCGLAIVPLPATTTAGKTFVEHLGHLWQLEPKMPGSADYRTRPSAAKLAAAMSALAKFHKAAANYSGPLASSSAGRLNAVRRHLARLSEIRLPTSAADFSQLISDSTLPGLAPLARQFAARLPQLIPQAIAALQPLQSAPLPTQPCIRDIWHDHILFAGDEVTGVIDFGALDFDTPATDIARILNSLSESPLVDVAGQGEGSDSVIITWQLGLAAYEQIRTLSADEIRAVGALAFSGNVLAGCNWLRWLYIEKRTFEVPEQIIERFRQIVARTKEPSSDFLRS